MTIWTGREWQLVASVLPPSALRPTPKQIDTAQRSVLPLDRHRPITSLYGRHNRAHYMAEIALARMRNEQMSLERRAHIASLRVQLAEIDRQIAELRREEAERPVLAQPEDPEPAPLPVVIAAVQPAVPKLNRVDVVGLIGDQVQRVRRELADDVCAVTRFIDTDALRRMSDPAGSVVLISSFVSHSAQAMYGSVRRVFVPKPTPRHVVPAIVQLATRAPV